MKFLIVLFVAIASGHFVAAQKLDSATIARLPAEKQELVKLNLRQANNARTTAFILCMAGGSLGVLGAVLAITEDINNDDYYDDGFDLNTGEQIMVVGGMVALTSIPFFIKVHNKRNEARAVINTSNGAMLSPTLSIPGTQGIGIGLVFRIGK